MNDTVNPKDVKEREVVREIQHADHAHQEHIIEGSDVENRRTIFRLYHLSWLIFGTIQALIGVRILLKLLAANPNNPFASLVYNTTDLFLWPFEGLVTNPSADGLVLEITSIIAILVYLIIAWGISKLIWVLFYKP
jgi:hypothetical protein